MILQLGLRVSAVLPRPNTGTGVKIPGEPVAVMAERFLGKIGDNRSFSPLSNREGEEYALDA